MFNISFQSPIRIVTIKIIINQNDSIESQVVALLQNALQTKIQQIEAQHRENVLKVLEESRLRREQLPVDIDSTEMIREDRDR